MQHLRIDPKAERGFTILEMVIVAGLIIVGSAVAIPVTVAMVRNARGDSAAVMTAAFLDQARDRAVAERRNIRVTFPTANTILLQRIEVPSGAATDLVRMTLEGEEQFIREGRPDTPDLFGGAGNINFTGAAPVMFTSDGSLIDSAGDVSNGTIFIARPNTPESARAVTVWGMTGMLRSWKWRGNAWSK